MVKALNKEKYILYEFYKITMSKGQKKEIYLQYGMTKNISILTFSVEMEKTV